jgi:hypothetical protein
MMQNQEQTVIFLHIPKAAGTTLRNILQRQYLEEEILNLHGVSSLEKLEKLSDGEKRQLKLIQGHFPFGVHEMLPQPSTYITMLRNPVKRVISTYFYAKRTPFHRDYETINQERMSLKDYMISKLNPVLNNGQVRLLSGEINVTFGDCNERMLEQAKNNLNKYFSVVGTLENFDQSLLAIKEILGYKNIFYTKLNTSQSKNDKEFDSEIIDLIKYYNNLDLELYNNVTDWQKESFTRLRVNEKLASFNRINTLYSWYQSLINPLKSTLNYSRETLKNIQSSQ